jgi:hypothetical protein
MVIQDKHPDRGQWVNISGVYLTTVEFPGVGLTWDWNDGHGGHVVRQVSIKTMIDSPMIVLGVETN